VPRSGKHVARGRGGNRIEKKSDGTYVNRGYVSLPETPYNPMTDRTCIGKLRIGLVCHEYAHAIEMLRFGHSDHGPRFTMILDSLLFETEKYWTKEAAIAAEVKS